MPHIHFNTFILQQEKLFHSMQSRIAEKREKSYLSKQSCTWAGRESRELAPSESTAVCWDAFQRVPKMRADIHLPNVTGPLL